MKRTIIGLLAIAAAATVAYTAIASHRSSRPVKPDPRAPGPLVVTHISRGFVGGSTVTVSKSGIVAVTGATGVRLPSSILRELQVDLRRATYDLDASAAPCCDLPSANLTYGGVTTYAPPADVLRELGLVGQRAAMSLLLTGRGARNLLVVPRRQLASFSRDAGTVLRSVERSPQDGRIREVDPPGRGVRLVAGFRTVDAPSIGRLPIGRRAIIALKRLIRRQRAVRRS